jgi:phosphatidylserine/phosphatidylglycerophosphate/cardiolipin synthase-like enzyme
MALPLQPDPVPAPPWRHAVIMVCGVVLGLAALGLVGAVRGQPPVLLISGPGQPLSYARAAERLIAGAQRRVWVMQYVIRRDEDGPVAGLLQALVAARARGVEVRVVLDRGMVFGTADPDPKNDDAAAWCVAHGLQVVWDEVSITSHAKALLVDDTAIVGSHNWTRSALIDNREISVVLSEPRQIASLEAVFRGIPGW